MFGGFSHPMFRTMDEDPFFTAHQAHMHGMHQMHMGFPPMMGITDGRQLQQRQPHRQQQSQHDMMMQPFGGMFGGLFNMDGMFRQMQQQMDGGAGGGHSFTSSSVMSYSNTGDGPPQMYQASSQTRTAPGGIKETRKMERDSLSGVDKMALGHHINDRGHVIARSRSRNGNTDESHDYLNLDEEEAESFNQEWQQRTSEVGRGLEGRHRAHRHHPTTPALPDPRHRHDRHEKHRDRSQKK